MKTKKQIKKCFKDVNKRHLNIYRRYNSPMDLGYTDIHLHAQMKWLERFAGFIQALRWVLSDDEDMPEQYTAIPDV